MKNGIIAIGAGLITLVAITGIASAQEAGEVQPVQQEQGTPSPQSSPTPQPGRSPQAAQTPAAPQITAEEVTEEQVEQLVVALSQIEPLLRQASAQIQSTQDQAERQQIEQQFESQATQVVQESGLTVNQYIQLVTLAQQDETFGQRVTEQLQELQAESQPQSESPVAPEAVPQTEE